MTFGLESGIEIDTSYVLLSLALKRRFSLTSQYNAKIKRKRRVAKLRRKKDKIHANIEKAKNK